MSGLPIWKMTTASLVCTGLLLAPAPSHAQSIVDQAAQQAEQINRQQSEQERLREIENLRALQRAPQGKPQTPPVPTVSGRNATCIQVNRVQVKGVTLLPPEKITRTTARWEGRCVGLAELNSILEALTFVYVERGYITSRAYLPEQDLSDGTVDVTVIEGSLEAVHPASAAGKGQIATAFPNMKGKPVNLRDIEQGLDQINRLQSQKATIALKAGKDQGGSALDVTVEKTKPWHVTLGADNLGSASTGIYQSRIDAGFDNVLGLNDQWQVGYQRSMDRHPWLFSKRVPNGDTITAAFSLPYGYWTAGVDGAWSHYNSSLQGAVSTIDTSGGSLMVSPYISRVLHRDQTSKTWMTGRLTWKDTENFILGSRIDVSSRKLSVARIELGHSRQFLGGQLSGNIAVHQGMDILGAFNDGSAPAASPKGQFTKTSFAVGYFRPQPVGTLTALFSTSLNGQWSDDPLFGSEQLSLGGHASIRGVREAVLYADRGVVMRNEVSLLVPVAAGAGTKIMQYWEPYVALDVGRTLDDRAGNSLGGTMVGAAAGVRSRGGMVGFDLFYADALALPKLPGGTKPPGGLAQARVSVSF